MKLNFNFLGGGVQNKKLAFCGGRDNNILWNCMLLVSLFIFLFHCNRKYYLICFQPFVPKPLNQFWVVFSNVWALQLLNCSVVLVLRFCSCNSSKTAQHFILVIVDAILLFSDPPLPCLFTVEVTKKNLATCPKRITRHVSKCHVKLKCMYIFNLNSQFVN